MPFWERKIKYVGSKNRISKYIVPIIQKCIDENNIKIYYEPFVGGANMIDKIKCENRIGNDIHKELIAMWNELQKGWIPTSHITEEEYISVRDNKEKYPDYYVGYVGYHATFGSKYFAGYARSFKADGVTPRDQSNEAYRNTMKQVPSIKDVLFTHGDYKEHKIKNAVIYCDPPYQGTTKYETESFDYNGFWEWCREMSKENWLFKSIIYVLYVNNFSTLFFLDISSPLLQSKFAKCSLDHIHSKSSGALYSLTKSQFY